MIEPRGPLLYYNISVKHPGLFQDFRKPVSASLNCQNWVCLCNRVNFSSCACSGSIRLGSTRASLTRPGPSKVSACHIFMIGNLHMMSRLRGGHLCAPGDPPARHAPAERRHHSLQEEESDQREGATHQVHQGDFNAWPKCILNCLNSLFYLDLLYVQGLQQLGGKYEQHEGRRCRQKQVRN